ncbi:MAG: hypothetical protein MUC49_06970 [Raineya sp.]|jgi:thymidylate kinase/thiamine kinase-like enzyme|nr:hypothetical protein [Raineya sp.]
MENIMSALGLRIVKSKTNEAKTFYYITNPDGTPRWIWSANNQKPEFLKFYNATTLKSKLFVWVCKIVFKLRLQHIVWFHKKLYAEIAEEDSVLQNYWSSNISVFTGTAGPNRKYLVYVKNQYNQGLFIKVALNKSSEKLLFAEKEVINKINTFACKSFYVPEILAEADSHLKLSDCIRITSRTLHFESIHHRVLTEVFLKTGKQISKKEFLKHHDLEARLEKLSMKQSFAIPQGMLKKLKYLIQSLEDSDMMVSFAHGDFTPWNMFKTDNQKLFIYDWELASENYPFAFDAFHYIIQKGILIEHKNWKDIENELYKTIKTFKLKEGFCFRKYLSLYLVVNTINYLEIFSQQYQWHKQVKWLLDTWNDAISFALKNHVIHRKLLVLDSFDFLFKQEYAGLKLPESSPEELGEYSDIDFCMQKPLASSLVKYLKNHSLVKKVVFRKTHTYSNILIQTEDNGILSIDTIHSFKRKSIQFLDTQEVLKTAYTDSAGIKKVSLMNSIRYIGFFYGLNGKTVPAKYTPYEEILERSPEEVDNLLYPFFLEGKTSRRALIQYLLKQPFNKGLNKWLNIIHYYLDLIKRVMFSKGMMITFSGVDGAGKSTVIELSKKELEKRLRKRVIVLRHRPSVLPILSAWTKGKEKAEQDAIQTLPRQGKNKNILSSLFRFAYYYTDYLLGQIIIYLKYILRGDVVLYDRYYFDFINDSVRSNIQLPKWIMKWGYYFLLKPQINFFLYADARTILNRKKELGQEDIESLNYQYSTLFKQLDKQSPNHYLLIENIDLQKTLKTITKEITSRML